MQDRERGTEELYVELATNDQEGMSRLLDSPIRHVIVTWDVIQLSTVRTPELRRASSTASSLEEGESSDRSGNFGRA